MEVSIDVSLSGPMGRHQSLPTKAHCVLLPCTSDTYDHSPMTLTDVLIEFVTTTCKVSMVWNEVPLAHCIGKVQLVCDLNMSQTSLKRRLFGVCGKRETVCRATWFVDNRSVCQGCAHAIAPAFAGKPAEFIKALSLQKAWANCGTGPDCTS
jgi:hypothetical protein